MPRPQLRRRLHQRQHWYPRLFPLDANPWFIVWSFRTVSDEFSSSVEPCPTRISIRSSAPKTMKSITMSTIWTRSETIRWNSTCWPPMHRTPNYGPGWTTAMTRTAMERIISTIIDSSRRRTKMTRTRIVAIGCIAATVCWGKTNFIVCKPMKNWIGTPNWNHSTSCLSINR